MTTIQIKKCVAMALVTANVCAAYAQSAVRDLANVAEAYTDRSREKREQAAAPDHIKEIFALAKKSADEDFNVNFSGFFVGMSRHDAVALAEYYKLKEGEYSIVATPGKAVSRLEFSLKGVRRITKGGSTLEELAQAVANRVGDLKHYRLKDLYELKTIDGVVLTLAEKGLVIKNDGVASQAPLATAEAAQKDKADVNAVEKAAAEEAARKERAAKEALTRLIRDMITIPGKNFKMGKYEVTQAQWQAVMGDNPSKFKGEVNPVENVSWIDCKEFLEKLNAMPEVKASGLTFRLPTEAEWEYACRAGSTGDYCWLADGTEITEDTLGKVAWYDNNSGSKAHPVGQKEPNAFGLYDMHGNVYEWCEDLYKAFSSTLVYRGGSWLQDSRSCMAGDRHGNFPHERYEDLGFRLVAQTKEEAARGKAEKEVAIREAQEAAIREKNAAIRAKKEVIQGIIQDMVAVPGKNYMIGKYEVTQKQWQAVMGENPSHFKGEVNPVENVSWDDCKKFREKLNAMPEVKASGLTFRLPTESEWEYACLAGLSKSLWSKNYCRLGNGITVTKDTLGKVAWYDGNSGNKAHPVGQKEPNAFGLYDMHGNVYEWCKKDKGHSRHYVFRGGGWGADSESCAADTRFKGRNPDYRNNAVGLRLAASQD